MAFENAEIKVTAHERVEDTNPELYVKRALDALNSEYYESALSEAEKAIRYDEKNLPEYRTVKALVLAKMERYEECLDYLNGESQLWELKKKGRLSAKDKSRVCYSCAVSLHGLSRYIDGSKDIIVTPDGLGMCKTIQEAVKKYPYSTILLTSGTYYEDVCIKDAEVRIQGIDQANTVFSGLLRIIDSDICIEGVVFSTNYQGKDGQVIVGINNSKIRFTKGVIKSNAPEKEGLVGFSMENCKSILSRDVSLSDVMFTGLKGGIGSCEGFLKLERCTFYQNFLAVTVGKEGRLEVESSRINNNTIAFTCLSWGQASINRCEVTNNRLGIYVEKNGKCFLNGSRFGNNRNDYEIEDGAHLEKRA